MEHPVTGASREETVSAQSEDAKEANGDRSKRERRQLQGRQDPPGVRDSRSRSLQEQEAPQAAGRTPRDGRV